MNATQTAIVEVLSETEGYLTVPELVELTAKGDTTVRTALKVLVEAGTVVKTVDGKKTGYMVQPAPVEAETAPEPAEPQPAPEAPQPQDEAVGAALDTAAAAAKPKKKYQRHATPQTRTTRTNQITKAQIGVRNLAESPDPRVTTKWYAICLTHNAVHGEDKLKDAHWFSTYPSFCPVCGPQLDGKEGRRRRHGVADKPAV